MAKTKVLIFPEEHTHFRITQELVRTIIPPYIEENKIDDLKQILNFSEGKDINDVYKQIFGNNSLFMVEESKKVLERHPILFGCLKYMTIILVEIENTLDYVYNKKKDNSADLLSGLHKKPFDENYIESVIIPTYFFNSFIDLGGDVGKGEQSFYNAFNTTYLTALDVNRHNDYETYLKHTLENAKPYFSKCDNDTTCNIKFTEIFNDLIKLNSPEERKPYIVLKRDELRKIRDKMIIDRIDKIITEKASTETPIVLVNIIIGVFHYDNIKKLVNESKNMELEKSQTDIDEFANGLNGLFPSFGGKIKKYKKYKKSKKYKKYKKYKKSNKSKKYKK